jgi:prepilin-type N-terminal cleavage/methylation domain-containing protein
MYERMRQMRDRDEGFTLIELLLVIIILGVLAAVVVFSVAGISDRGNTSACKATQAAISTASEAYFAKHGTYPLHTTDLQGAGSGVTSDRFLGDLGSTTLTADAGTTPPIVDLLKGPNAGWTLTVTYPSATAAPTFSTNC